MKVPPANLSSLMKMLQRNGKRLTRTCLSLPSPSDVLYGDLWMITIPVVSNLSWKYNHHPRVCGFQSGYFDYKEKKGYKATFHFLSIFVSIFQTTLYEICPFHYQSTSPQGRSPYDNSIPRLHIAKTTNHPTPTAYASKSWWSS